MRRKTRPRGQRRGQQRWRQQQMAHAMRPAPVGQQAAAIQQQGGASVRRHVTGPPFGGKRREAGKFEMRYQRNGQATEQILAGAGLRHHTGPALRPGKQALQQRLPGTRRRYGQCVP